MNVSGHTFKVYFITLHHAVSHTATRASQCETSAHHTQEGNEGKQGGHNSPGANSLLWGRWITAGVTNYYGSHWKVPTMSQVLSSIHSKFTFKKADVPPWGCQTSTMGWGLLFDHRGAKLVFCPRRHPTSLRAWSHPTC